MTSQRHSEREQEQVTYEEAARASPCILPWTGSNSMQQTARRAASLTLAARARPPQGPQQRNKLQQQDCVIPMALARTCESAAGVCQGARRARWQTRPECKWSQGTLLVVLCMGPCFHGARRAPLRRQRPQVYAGQDHCLPPSNHKQGKIYMRCKGTDPTTPWPAWG